MENSKVITRLEDNYSRINQSNAKWMDKRVKYLLARIFTGKGQLVSSEEFDWLDTALSKKSGLFSSLSKISRQTIVGLMLSTHLNSVEGIEELFFNKKVLKDNGFKSSSSTYFAAYQLFFTPSDKREAVSQRALRLFKEIKKTHPFITGTNDYSLMVSLAQAEQLANLSDSDINEAVDFYVDELKQMGLKNKETCLVASNLALLMTGSQDVSFIDTLHTLVDDLKQRGFKVKGIHYISLVSLAYIMQKNVSIELDDLMEFVDEVCDNVTILFEKEYKQALALSLFVESQSSSLAIHDVTTLSVSLNQIIIQEQTLIATTTTAAFKTSNN
ncbi:MAG: DUF4003 family protein [Vagococcus sp.]